MDVNSAFTERTYVSLYLIFGVTAFVLFHVFLGFLSLIIPAAYSVRFCLVLGLLSGVWELLCCLVSIRCTCSCLHDVLSRSLVGR